MKIQCDVCEKQEASVFCAADEAALCEGCDHRVHHANKLANKHQRFSLLHPSFKEAPLCDICQERRAFLFCREDRAILCRECDIPIHKANEHTQTHNRFLLTGVRISASSSVYPSASPLSSSSSDPNSRHTKSANVSSYDYDMPSQHSYYSNNTNHMATTPSSATTTTSNYNQFSDQEASISMSDTMSEYLMDTLPCWRLEDLLDSSSAPHCKTSDYTNSVTTVNSNQQVEDESMGSFFPSQDYLKMWDLHDQGPFVPTHLPPIFLQTL